MKFFTTAIITGIVGVISFVLLMILYYGFGITTFDHAYYYNAVNLYFQNSSPYNESAFIYLDYFCILYAYLLLPFWMGLVIHIGINSMIVLYFMKELEKNETMYFQFWIYTNIIILYADIVQLNVNTLIPLVFYVYYKYRDQYPQTVLLMIFAFYKITSICIYVGIIILDLCTKRDWKTMVKEFLYFGIVEILWIGSYMSSDEFISNGLTRTGSGLNIESILHILQPQHYFMYSFLFYVVMDKWQWKGKGIYYVWGIYFTLFLLHYTDHTTYYLWYLWDVDWRIHYIDIIEKIIT